MTLATMRTAVKDRLAIRSDGSGNSLDGLITNAFVDTSINNALKRVCIERNWWWMQTTASVTFAANTGLASLPTGFMHAIDLTINGNSVEPIDLDTYNNADAQNSGYGWLIFGSNVRISPAPTAAVTGTLYYVKAEPTLTADSDVPIMPDVYTGILVAYACHLCAARRQDEQRAALYLQEYGNFLKSFSDENRASVKRRIKYTRTRDFATWD
jgi:hypothetical protein